MVAFIFIRSTCFTFIFALTIFFSIFFVQGVSKADTNNATGVAAVVNGSAITAYDVIQRIQLVMLTSRIKPSQENTKNLKPQVLNALIDEELVKQDAKKRHIQISRQEEISAFERILQENDIPKATLLEVLKKRGINIQGFLDQIRGQLLWQKILESLRNEVVVSTFEIKQTLRKTLRESNKSSYLLSEVVLPFAQKKEKITAYRQAKQLIQAMQAGAQFSPLAQEFSKAPSAANGGKIGWVYLSQITKKLRESVLKTKIGSVYKYPIPIKDSYVVLMVEKERRGRLKANPLNDRYTLVHLIFRIDDIYNNREVEQREKNAKKFVRIFRSCDELETVIKKVEKKETFIQRSKLVTLSVRNMNKKIKDTIIGLRNGDITKSILTKNGIEVLVVCAYNPDVDKVPTYDSVSQIITNRKLNLIGQEHLARLRRTALVSRTKAE